jgi:hypothetical protein
MFKNKLIKEIETFSKYKRREIAGYLNFKTDLNVRDSINSEVKGMIENINSITIYRMNGKIVNFISRDVFSDIQKVQKSACDWDSAFGTIESLNNELKGNNLTDIQVKVINDEINYLTFLDNIKKEKLQKYESYLLENITIKIEENNNNGLKLAI